MADERLQAFAEYLARFPSGQAGEFTGRNVYVRLIGEPRNVSHQCVLIDYDAVGIHVKDSTVSGAPSETQFYLWHMIASIKRQS